MLTHHIQSAKPLAFRTVDERTHMAYTASGRIASSAFITSFIAMLTLSLIAQISLAQPFAWTQKTGVEPSPRYVHAMCYDSLRAQTVLFGGEVGEGNSPSNETWEWNGDAWSQHVVSGPTARQSHAMSFDSGRGVTVLFGGNLGSAVLAGDTWEWNGSVWTPRSVVGPPPRRGHAMAYDSARGVTVLFGGYTGTPVDEPAGWNNETWEWDGTTWTQRLVSGPSPRMWHAMAYDSKRGVVVLFGGTVITGNGFDNETWEWNGIAWTQRPVTGPSARAKHAMAFNSGRNVCVLVGGDAAGTPSGDVWEWNGNVWSQKSVSGPSSRSYHKLAYDSARNATVLFGGFITYVTGALGETWELNCVGVSSSPSNQAACSTGGAGFAVASAGPGTPTYQWQYRAASQASLPTTWTNIVNGVNSVGGTFAFNATGARRNLLVVDRDPFTWPAVGVFADLFVFRCIVNNSCGTVTSDAATLSICAADTNCDGFVDFTDFDAFVTAFETDEPAGDFNADGFLDFTDFDSFVDAFEFGC